jgi:hypothetical protein
MCYAPNSKTCLKTRQPRILFSLLSALINHACFRGWRVKTRQPNFARRVDGLYFDGDTVFYLNHPSQRVGCST